MYERAINSTKRRRDSRVHDLWKQKLCQRIYNDIILYSCYLHTQLFRPHKYSVSNTFDNSRIYLDLCTSKCTSSREFSGRITNGRNCANIRGRLIERDMRG